MNAQRYVPITTLILFSLFFIEISLQNRAHAQDGDGCGGSCNAYEQCVDGNCICGNRECADYEICEFFFCKDTRIDASNCGGAGIQCGPDKLCNESQCVESCPKPSIICNQKCTDVQNNNTHCGSCGNSCPIGQGCLNGQCQLLCLPHETICDGRCVDLTRDETHCGTCGNSCEPSERCIDAGGSSGAASCQLVCAGELTVCGPQCVDTEVDDSHCGGCGTACPIGTECRNGSCQSICQPGQTLCAGKCVYTDSDRSHCGSCGAICPPGTRCDGQGNCVLSCAPGLTICSGACINLDTNDNHCGACGVVCPLGQVCNGYGQCVKFTECKPGLTFCTNRCVNLDSDTQNCGACGVTCADGKRCDGSGRCAISCHEGLTRCGAECIDVLVDENNCGGCDITCAAHERCEEGTCIERNYIQSHAASELFLPYWSLGKDETDIYIHLIGGNATIELQFFNADGMKIFVAEEFLRDQESKTLSLRELSPLLESARTGSIVLILTAEDPAADVSAIAESVVKRAKEKTLLRFTHLGIQEGVWTHFDSVFAGQLPTLEFDMLIAQCPVGELAQTLLSLGRLPFTDSQSFASSVDITVIDTDGVSLARSVLKCAGILEVQPRSLSTSKTGKAITLKGSGGVKIRTGGSASSTNNDGVFIVSAMMSAHPASKKTHKGLYASKYLYASR